MENDTNTNGGNGEDKPQTIDGPVPVLAVQGSKLTYITPKGIAEVELEDLVRGASLGQGPIGLLLYGILLKLHDIDRSLRTTVEMTKGQIDFAQGFQANPGAIIDQVVESLKKLGVPGVKSWP